MKLSEKLSKIQAILDCPKNQYNSFGKYKYRSLEDIFEGLKKHITTYNVSVTTSDEIIIVGDRIYVKATATIRCGETNEEISNVAYAREPKEQKGMSESQVTGATSSYARKYALNGLFAIDDIKDSDSTNTHGKDKPKSLNTAKTAQDDEW